MKKDFSGFSRKSGIYCILNDVNGRIYIGSCKEFRRRISGHLCSLNKNVHQNKYLQADFNKHGTDAFTFKVLEVLEGTKYDRVIVEKSWLEKHYDNQNQCYNLRPDPTVSTEGIKLKKPVWNKGKSGYKLGPCSEERKAAISRANKGRVLTEEAKKRISISVSKKNKELWQQDWYRKKCIEGRIGLKFSDEARQNISKALKGKPKSEKHRQALKEAWKRRKEKQQSNFRIV